MSYTKTSTASSDTEFLKKELEDVKDMELVNRLDILNLKNEIDQLKITLPQSIERIPREELTELVKIAEKIKDIKKLKSDIDEIESMKKEAASHPEAVQQLKEELDELKHRFGFYYGHGAEETPICKHCGTDLPSVAKFCKQCGTKV